MSEAHQVLLCTVPDRDTGRAIARRLVEERLAACVNILPGVTSVYAWKGEVNEDEELLLVIKSRAGRYAELERAVVELHPYELPEVVAVPVSDGLPGYLAWIDESTGTHKE